MTFILKSIANCINSEPVDALVHPKSDDIAQFLDHGRVAQVQVGLIVRKGTVVVLFPSRVITPCRCDQVVILGKHALPVVWAHVIRMAGVTCFGKFI